MPHDNIVPRHFIWPISYHLNQVYPVWLSTNQNNNDESQQAKTNDWPQQKVSLIEIHWSAANSRHVIACLPHYHRRKLWLIYHPRKHDRTALFVCTSDLINPSMCRPILKESASHLWLFWSSVGLNMRKENKWLGFIATACASVLLLPNSHSDSGWPWSASYPPKSHSMQSLHFRTGNMVQLNIGSTTEGNAQKMFLKRELTWIYFILCQPLEEYTYEG